VNAVPAIFEHTSVGRVSGGTNLRRQIFYLSYSHMFVSDTPEGTRYLCLPTCAHPARWKVIETIANRELLTTSRISAL
jgi:hypothetical protein